MKTVDVVVRWLAAVGLSVLLSACGGGGSSGSTTPEPQPTPRPGGSDFTVSASVSVSGGGRIEPPSRAVSAGNTTTFTVTPDPGFFIDDIDGCDGIRTANADNTYTYITGDINNNCSVTARFTTTRPSVYTVSVRAGTGVGVSAGGKISPNARQEVNAGDTARFTLTPNTGFFPSVSGCGGRLSGHTYTTDLITRDCTVNATFTPAATTVITPSTPALNFAPTKLLRFTWADAPGATHYRLLENPDGNSGFEPVDGGESIGPGVQAFDHQVPLFARVNAQYILQSCVNNDCHPSGTVAVSGTLVDSIGYVKAGNAGAGNAFGTAISLNDAGDTLVVGAPFENGTGSVYVFTRGGTTWRQQAHLKPGNAGGDDAFGTAVSLNSAGDILAVGAIGEDSGAGAVYVFTRSGDTWSQPVYIKASNTQGGTSGPASGDRFGGAVSLNGTGDTLAVGADREDSAATGIDGDKDNNSAADAGAVYVFTRTGTTWSEQAYIKAGNAGESDRFGIGLSLNRSGDTLAVGASGEGSNGGQSDNSVPGSGAVYVFTRTGTTWSQQAYIKAGNIGADNQFGASTSLDGTGDTLAVGAPFENGSGAAYVFTRGGTIWTQQGDPIQASNADRDDSFGDSVSLNRGGDTLAVGARFEGSAASGIDDDQNNNSAIGAGAVYVFTRDGTGTAWRQQAYIKASNTDADADGFGGSVSLSGSGDTLTLAVGAPREGSAATGVNPPTTATTGQNDNSARSAGAVYLY